MRKSEIQADNGEIYEWPTAPREISVVNKDTLNIRLLVKRVLEYKWMIVSIMTLFFGLSWIILEQIPSRYTATSVVLLNPPGVNILNMDEVVEDLDTSPEALGGQIIQIKSLDLIREIARDLDIYQFAKSTGWTNDNGPFRALNPINYIPEVWRSSFDDFWLGAKAAIFGERPSENNATEPGPEEHHRMIIDRFRKRLTVEQIPDTWAINISFSLENPALAADAANSLAELYIAKTLEDKHAAARHAALWLSDQLDEMRKKVELSEAEAGTVRKNEAQKEGRNIELYSNQITALNEELVHAKAEISQLSARLDDLKEIEKSASPQQLNSVVVDSRIIDALQVERLEFERSIAALSSQYGPKHPKILQIKKEIDDIDHRIHREIKNHVINLENQIAIAQHHERLLEELIQKLHSQVGDLNAVNVQLQSLERETEGNRRIYEAIVTRYNEASAQVEAQKPDARIVSYAEVPEIATYPPRQKVLYGSVVLSLCFAGVLVYTVTRLEVGFRSVRELEDYTGLPVLGIIPEVKLDKHTYRCIADYIGEDVTSRLSECLGTIFGRLFSRRGKNAKNCFLFTSASPEEGKSSTCAAFARRIALFGQSVLLVDLDLRHPRIHNHLTLPSAPGVTDILSGEVTLENAVQEEKNSGLKFIPCGSTVDDPVGLIASSACGRLIQHLKERYDTVIVDCPPVLAAADAKLIAEHVDQCIVLVRWEKTERDVVISALKELTSSGSNVVGLIMTRVDIRKNSYYGYGEYGYYTKKMTKYYGNPRQRT